MGEKCISICLDIERTDLIFGPIFSRFGVSQELLEMFLTILEKFILDKRLKDIPKFFVDDFMDSKSRTVDQIEQVLVNIEFKMHDFSQEFTKV